MGRMQVLFSGEVANGASEAAVRQNLMRRLGLDERKVSQLFSGRTVVIRSDLSRDAADKLQAELAELGAIARIRDSMPDDKAKFAIDARVDQTLKDITAAHIECPRCGHLQLEAEFCTRCGVDIAAAMKLKRKEDALIEKKIRTLKEPKSAVAAPAMDQAVAPAAPVEEPAERIEPIKRRTADSRAGQDRTVRPRPASPAAHNAQPSNPFGNSLGGGFWRKMLKLGRKD